MMQASKKMIDRAVANGSLATMDRLVSASHILTEMADWLMNDANDLARANGMVLGEVKQAQTLYRKAHDRYTLLWRDLVRGSHMTAERNDDFDHFMPYVARLLSVDDVTTDPNTGKTVRECWSDYDGSKKAGGGKAFKGFGGMGGGAIKYRASELTDGMREALGKETNVSFRSHANVSKLFTAYAERAGTTRRDILNEALLQYIENVGESGLPEEKEERPNKQDNEQDN